MNRMALVQIVLRYRFVLDKLDLCFLIFLLIVLDPI
jgi:hypothetical protein